MAALSGHAGWKPSSEEESRTSRVKSLISSFLHTKEIEHGSMPNLETPEIEKIPENRVKDTSPTRELATFLTRLWTFNQWPWFGKPMELNPVRCARHGWKRVEEDMLQCVTCSAYMSTHLPPVTKVAVYQSCLERVQGNLVSAHKPHCRWILLPEKDAAICSDWSEQNQSVESFISRLSSCCRLGDQLPVISKETVRTMGLTANAISNLSSLDTSAPIHLRENEPSDMKLESTVVCALAGWTARQNSSTLCCKICQREIGVWNFRHAAARITDVEVTVEEQLKPAIMTKSMQQSSAEETTEENVNMDTSNVGHTSELCQTSKFEIPSIVVTEHIFDCVSEADVNPQTSLGMGDTGSDCELSNDGLDMLEQTSPRQDMSADDSSSTGKSEEFGADIETSTESETNSSVYDTEVAETGEVLQKEPEVLEVPERTQEETLAMTEAEKVSEGSSVTDTENMEKDDQATEIGLQASSAIPEADISEESCVYDTGKNQQQSENAQEAALVIQEATVVSEQSCVPDTRKSQQATSTVLEAEEVSEESSVADTRNHQQAVEEAQGAISAIFEGEDFSRESCIPNTEKVEQGPEITQEAPSAILEEKASMVSEESSVSNTSADQQAVEIRLEATLTIPEGKVLEEDTRIDEQGILQNNCSNTETVNCEQITEEVTNSCTEEESRRSEENKGEKRKRSEENEDNMEISKINGQSVSMAVKNELQSHIKRRKADCLNPLAEHRAWCPWVATSPLVAGENMLPGWRCLLELLQRHLVARDNPGRAVIKGADQVPLLENVHRVRQIMKEWKSPSLVMQKSGTET